MATLFKSMLLGLFIFPLLMFSNSAKASHVMGADITYQCIDSFKFKIVVTFYRDCLGVGFSNPSAQTAIRCASGGSQGVNLSLDGIKEITPICATATGGCVPPNTFGSGEGVEQHRYSAVIDFNQSPYNNLKNCCNIIIETGQCCRNGAINTGPVGDFYTYAELNLCKAPCNSSPALTSEPIGVLCCNQAFFFNNGASDTSNFDSLSYKWANPLSGWSTNLGYSGDDYAYNHPFAAYYPGNLTPPYNNPKGSPPIGIYLDPNTGDITLTPVRCDEVTVAVIEITEWRKDEDGDYEKIGATRRDMQFITQTCPDNNPPVVNGPYSYVICAGEQLCFNVTTDDVQFIPPPPAQAADPDTVRISWNGGIPGATFNVINPTARLQTGRFCWTPEWDHASDLPYNFTVTARDNACPRNAVTVRGFQVRVKHRAQDTREYDTLPCGTYAVKAVLIPGFKGTATYSWELLDSNRNPVFNRKLGKFRSTGTYLSNKSGDTLDFRRGGTYYIQHTVNNAPNNCPVTYYDTLEVPPLLEATITLEPDTYICAGTTLEFAPKVLNGNPPVKFQWSTMGIFNNGKPMNNGTVKFEDTLSTFELTVPMVTYDTGVSVYVRDATGCTSEDTVRIFLKENPVAYLPSDPRICTYDSVKLRPTFDTAYWLDRSTQEIVRQGDTLFKQWYFDGAFLPFSLADTVVINQRGEYILRVLDELGCFDEDTLYLFVNDTVQPFAGEDQTLCFNDTLNLSASGLDTSGNGKSGTYRWYNLGTSPKTSLGTAQDLEYIAQDSTSYELELYITQGGVECFDEDTMLVHVNPLPEINLKQDFEVCCDYGNISMSFHLNSVNPTGGPGFWDVPAHPTWESNDIFFTDSACGATPTNVDVRYTYTNPTTLCVNEESIRIRVKPLPPVEFRQDRDFCQDIGVIDMEEELIRRPANTNTGTQSWECLECNGNDFSQMLVDNGVAGAYSDYDLKISEDYYTIQNDQIDTVELEYTFIDAFGCRNTDTVKIQIWKVPVVTFGSGRPLCWNEGEISLDELFDVGPLGGVWSVVDTAGYRNLSSLGGLSGDEINTTNSTPLSSPTATPNRYWLRYEHTLTGCYASNDTTLLINPLPNITLTPLGSGTPPVFCDVDANRNLQASPTGGTWSSNDAGSLVGGNAFSPSGATPNKLIRLMYEYTSPATGCTNHDSIFARVDPSPSVSLPADTTFCRTMGSMQENLTVNAVTEHTSNLNWNSLVIGDPPTGSASVSNTSVSSADVQFNTENSRQMRFAVTASTGNNGACFSTDDIMFVTINPIPDGSIVAGTANGCNPVQTDFILTLNNDIDPDAATYDWTLGNGSNSESGNPVAMYTTDGTNQVSLILSSEAGCDTTLTTTVDVYPLPVADFVPNPDNFTTAALPRFTFRDESTVSDVLGSSVENWFWDFSDPNSDIDTSYRQNPAWFYSADTATYEVKLVVETNYGCKDSFYYPVIVGPDLIVYIPNAFTPNGAGPQENDRFRAIVSGEKFMELTIFNRWGEVMFSTTDKNERWDGTYLGVPCQQDVYAYQLKATALNDKEYIYTGTITLIR